MPGLSSRALARIGAVGATAMLVTGPVTAASAATVPTVDGYAYGVSVTGPGVSVAPTPEVTLPPGGSSGPITKSVVGVNDNLPTGTLQTGTLSVITNGATTAPQPHQSASRASVSNVFLTLDSLLSTNLTIQSASSDCRSVTGGSSGGTQITGGTIEGVPIAVDPAPNTTVSFTGGTATFNKQTVSDAAGATSITVDVADVHFNGGEQVILGESHCSAEGPDIQVPVGAAGGVLLAGTVGIGFLGYQWQRRRHAHTVE